MATELPDERLKQTQRKKKGNLLSTGAPADKTQDCNVAKCCSKLKNGFHYLLAILTTFKEAFL